MTAVGTNTLPLDFLAGPAPNAVLKPVNFKNTQITDYDGLYAVVIDGIMTEDECKQLVVAAERRGEWERALINVGGGQQQMMEDVRKCGRIIWDNQDIMDKLWARIAPFTPELENIENWRELGLGRNHTIQFTRLNERMRILQYKAGNYFKPHWDGTYFTPGQDERSYFTLHVYLNDKEHQPVGETLVGGATTFWSWDRNQRHDVNPKIGSVLIFQHAELLHSGDDLVSGTKITLRTDLMYKDED